MKKKFFSFISIVLVLFCVSSASLADVNQDFENHKIIGGLYTLAAAVELNAKTNPDVNSLVRFFERIPPGWQNEVKIERDKNKKSIWVGIAVDESSNARSYLRSHAKELGILDAPDGAAWIGSETAWIKAADIARKKITPVNFSASEGQDKKIFFKAPKSESWWAAWPNFNSSSKKKILEAHGIEDVPGLVAPKSHEEAPTSIYETVKPYSIRVPDQMHMGTKRNSFDMSVEVGDVIFNPIPNIHK